MRIYVASSWRNTYQSEVVKRLRSESFEVYDFKQPVQGEEGFRWEDIDHNWMSWDAEQHRDALQHPTAKSGFASDESALQAADATVLVLPCGRSAHLELGYAAGRGQYTAVLMPNPSQPELMYLLCDQIFTDIDSLVQWLHERERLAAMARHSMDMLRRKKAD